MAWLMQLLRGKKVNKGNTLYYLRLMQVHHVNRISAFRTPWPGFGGEKKITIMTVKFFLINSLYYYDYNFTIVDILF